jgi:hypothetical protein
MEIRFVSSLTADDEDRFAPALLAAVSAILDQLPIAYTIRIETTGSLVFQHTHGATTSQPMGLDAASELRRIRAPPASSIGSPRS